MGSRRQPETPDEEPAPRADRERHVRARPDTVWEVLADPGQRRAVFGGDLDVDLVEDARGTWSSPEEAPRPVHVRRVDPARRLVFDWGDGDEASTVDLRLVPAEGGTDVRVVETRHEPVATPRASARAAVCLAA